MYISIAEAQGQLLELVRRVEAGEEVLLTHEGETVGVILPLSSEERRLHDDNMNSAPPRQHHLSR